MSVKIADHEAINLPDNFEDPGLPNRHVFSPSQYKMYKRCPKQYYFRYILDRKTKPGVALIQGTSIHKGAEVVHQTTIDTGTPLALQDANDAISDSFDSRKKEIVDWDGNDPGLVKDRTLMCFATYYRTAVPAIRPKKVEAGFAVKFGTVPVLGFIDLVDEVFLDIGDKPDDENLPRVTEVVSDLKFTGRKWTTQQIEFDPQLTFYAHVEGTPRVRFDFLIDAKSGTRYVPERSLRDPSHVKSLIEDLEETVYLIKKGIFPRILQTEWGCTPKWCGFYEECRGQK